MPILLKLQCTFGPGSPSAPGNPLLPGAPWKSQHVSVFTLYHSYYFHSYYYYSWSFLLVANIHKLKMQTYSFTNRSMRAHRARVSTLPSLTLLTLRSNHSLRAWWALEWCHKMYFEARFCLNINTSLSTTASDISMKAFYLQRD